MPLCIYLFSGIFEKPIYVGTLDGNVYNNPRFDSPKDTVLTTSDETIRFIQVTDSISKGYPWFLIGYGKSSKGYMWGGNLCAKEIWINGLGNRCDSHKQVAMPKAFENDIKKDENIADVIELLHSMLPGLWVSRNNMDGQYEFNNYKEIIDKGSVIGWWSIEVEKNFLGYPSFNLHLDYKSELNLSHKKFVLTYLSLEALRFQEALLSKHQYSRASQTN